MAATSAADYIQIAKVFHVARTSQMASAVAVLYDHAITFDREVDHVWTHPRSFGSIMYLLIRYIGDGLSILNAVAYLGPGVQTDNVFVRLLLSASENMFTIGPTHLVNSCKDFFFVQAWLNILVLFLIQIMLQVRLYALYQRSRIVLALMISGYMCEIAAMSIIMFFVGDNGQFVNEIQPGFYICADTKGPPFYHQYIVWLPVILYDSALCLLALWHGISHWISGYRVKRIDGVYIADALIKGNAVYCLCIVLACVVSVVVGQYVGPRWSEVSQGYPVTMEAIVGCRLTLNLRLLLVREVETEYDGGDVSNDAPWDTFVNPLSTCLREFS